MARSCALLEAPPRFGLGVELLQSSALPLGYGAVQPRIFYQNTQKKSRVLANIYIIILQKQNIRLVMPNLSL